MLNEWTLCAIPQSFIGVHMIRQMNALESWIRLEPKPTICLFGNDHGVRDTAKGFGCVHVPLSFADLSPLGVPYLRSALGYVQEHSSDRVVVYVNSDIVLMNDFVKGLSIVADHFPDQFMMVSQRWDVNITGFIDFNATLWDQKLRHKVVVSGQLHRPGSADYIAFTTGLFPEFPPFVVGRMAWDNDVMGDVVCRGIPMVDATEYITVVHQDIPPNHKSPKNDDDREGVRIYHRRRNARTRLYGRMVMGATTDAQYVLMKEGKVKKR